jgi:hypothetical protein
MRQPPPIVIVTLCALGASGCGALGGGGGGGDNLPNRGIAPYVRVELGDEEAPERHVLTPDDAAATELREPAAVVDAGRVLLYVEVRDRASGAAYVARTVSDADGTGFGPLDVALTPEDAPDWAGARVGAPSVLRDGDRWLMAFAFGDGEGIGLARSDDGERFVVDAAPLLTRDAALEAWVGSPSLVRFGGALTLFYEARGAEADALAHVARARVDGTAATRLGPVLSAGSGCIGADGAEDPCWDRSGVGAPEVRVSRTATGRELLRLFYTGFAGKRGDLGFAASFDGADWSRFVFNPVVAESDDEREATNVRLGDAYLLYFVEVASGAAHGVDLAINDEGVPSEQF